MGRKGLALVVMSLLVSAGACTSDEDPAVTAATGSDLGAQSEIDPLCDGDVELLSRAGVSFGCDGDGRAAIGDGGALEPVTMQLELQVVGNDPCVAQPVGTCDPPAPGPTLVESTVDGHVYRFPRGGDWITGPGSEVAFVPVPEELAERILDDGHVAGVYLDEHWCGKVETGGSAENRWVVCPIG